GAHPRFPPGSGMGGGGEAMDPPLSDLRLLRLPPFPDSPLSPVCALPFEALGVCPAILSAHPVSPLGLRLDRLGRIFDLRHHDVGPRNPGGVRRESSRDGRDGAFISPLPLDRSVRG